MHPKWLLLAALLLTTVLYWPGLSGPFMLDDFHNLLPLQQWLDGTASWQTVVFGNGSGLLGRSVSMASFLLQAWLGGVDSFDFKLGNLIAHLLCGLLAWQVLRRVLARDERLTAHADLVASAIVALWLLHPLNVSTVLYAVQRMAQMSTLFVLASLWAYLWARKRLEDGQQGHGLAGLFLLFPLLFALGVLSKENAAVASTLCLVLELACFSHKPRPRWPLLGFYGLFLLLPLLVAGALLLHSADSVLGGYQQREFSIVDRLLTQPRALFDYIGQLLLPRSPGMGLYTDDFPISTSLVTPPSTLLALLGLLGISALAFALRRRAPMVFAGWFFFLVAHGVESSFLPLELYFEHRNYLPSFGLFLMVAGLLSLFPQSRNAATKQPLRGGTAIILLIALVLSFATFGRVLIWQYNETIVAQALKHHPESLRANLEQATIALRSGRHEDSKNLLTSLTKNRNPRTRTIGYVDLVIADCRHGLPGNPAYLATAIADTQPRLTSFEAYSWQLLATTVAKKPCGAVDAVTVAEAIASVLAKASRQSRNAEPQWLLRLAIAQLYARNNLWGQALPYAEAAWKNGSDPVAGELLVRTHLNLGNQRAAQTTLSTLAGKIRPFDLEGQNKMKELTRLARPSPATQTPPP